MNANYLDAEYDFNGREFVSIYDELPYWSAAFGQKILEYFPYRKNLSVLDIGFGTGFPVLEVAMRLGRTSRVYGVDPWKAAIERANYKISAYGLNNITLFDGVAEALPVSDNSVDVVMSNNGLNNVKDFNKSIDECYRVMKHNAELLFTFNLETSMMEFYNVLECVLKEASLNDSLIKLKEHIYSKRKPVHEIINILKNRGFINIESIEDKFEYKFVDATAMFNYHFIKIAFLNGWKTIVPDNIRHEIFSKIESILNEKALIEGYLTLTVPYVLIKCIKK